ncbi:MAG: cyclic nucleotide-binding domain-containing protein, partial [Gammaproteobacteria bacterium]
LDTNQPHVVTAVTTTPVRVLVLDKDYLDLVLTWDQAGNYLVQDLEEEEVLDADADWMSCLLQSRLFASIPPANIQQLFAKFEEARVSDGDVVVKQGDPGDYFYVVKSGVARISRRVSTGGNTTDVVLAELRAGDVFGEDALIGDAPRNATVQMVSEGSLMRLDKKDFQSLMQDPVLEFIEYEELQNLLQQEDRRIEILDVRLPLEFKQGHIPGSRSVPLHSVRQIVRELDPDVTYVTACDGGRRSTLAAYLLNQYGFEALVLKDPPDLESTAA